VDFIFWSLFGLLTAAAGGTDMLERRVARQHDSTALHLLPALSLTSRICPQSSSYNREIMSTFGTHFRVTTSVALVPVHVHSN